ncbi:HAMP domain-containing sensor histidine kinase [Desulfonatronospira sp.]|uniref:sensor histidine kinase n=1 Tax=Desulfonatronospira sp. TaxID=1962951 RepID=UPI0025BD361E|nr:HAMP domain-containing sensor histidine kinase [Desulfonatronospira sp.]
MNNDMIPDFAGKTLNDYLAEYAALILLTLDWDGRIRQANRFTHNLVGKDVTGSYLSEVIVDFTGSFDLRTALQQGDRQHLFNVNSHTGLPQTFYFRFMEQEGKILAVGELNLQETEDLRKNLVQLNNEFSNLNRELQKKNTELTKLNELKNHFLGMAAHDLRNPLGAIRNLSEFLLEEASDSLSAEYIQFLEIIHSSSNFMLSLLDQLLDIARIEAGKLELDYQSTDLISLIKSSVDINKILAEKKKVQIRLEHFEAIPFVELDSMKIEQVMHNLLSNAVKFSPEGGLIKVHVFLSGNHVTVSVTDKGPGIPEEDIQKLYQPFAKTSVKAPGGEKSTGLGLAIVHKIILGHMGKIWVESKVDHGTTFFFSLPLKAGGKAL